MKKGRRNPPDPSDRFSIVFQPLSRKLQGGNMKRLLAALVCLVLSSAAFSEGNEERESKGGPGMREFDCTGFTVVETGYGIDVKVVQSQSYGVALFADPEIMDRVVIEASGRTLRIGRRWEFFPLPWNHKARVEISMPTLEGLSASGGSHIDVAMDASAGEIFVRMSGGSSLAGSVSADSMEIRGSGGSSAELSGSARTLRISGSGGSRFRLAGFPARTLDADLSGGSWAEGTVSDSLDVRASGGSHVSYHGDARIERQNLSGGSWIRRE
jgi:hypothetical protein